MDDWMARVADRVRRAMTDDATDTLTAAIQHIEDCLTRISGRTVEALAAKQAQLDLIVEAEAKAVQEDIAIRSAAKQKKGDRDIGRRVVAAKRLREAAQARRQTVEFLTNMLGSLEGATIVAGATRDALTQQLASQPVRKSWWQSIPAVFRPDTAVETAVDQMVRESNELVAAIDQVVQVMNPVLAADDLQKQAEVNVAMARFALLTQPPGS